MNKIIQAFVIIGLCSMAFGGNAQDNLALAKSYSKELSIVNASVNEATELFTEKTPGKSHFSNLFPKSQDSLNTRGERDFKERWNFEKSTAQTKDWELIPPISSGNTISPITPSYAPITIDALTDGDFETPGSENDVIAQKITTVQTTVSRTNAQAASGSYSLLLSYAKTKPISVKPGKLYVFSVKLFVPLNYTGNKVNIFAEQAGGSISCNRSDAWTKGVDGLGQWKEFKVFFKGTIGKIVLTFLGGNTSTYFYIDQIILQEYTIVDNAIIDNNNGTITVNPSGGYPGASYVFDWSNGSNTSTLTGLSPGSYSLFISQTIPNVQDNCAYQSFDYKICSSIGTPTASYNPPICLGADLKLFAKPVDNATYIWTAPNGTVYKTQNPVIKSITAADLGIYKVRALVNGCYGPESSVNVVSDSPLTPEIESNAPVCVGNPLTMSVKSIPGAGATEYNWTGPRGFTSKKPSFSITGVTTNNEGIYTVTAKVNGCVSTVASFDVKVIPKPQTPPAYSNSPVCQGKTLELSTDKVDNATYIWQGPNRFISTLQNPTISGFNTINVGNYTLTIKVNDCLSGQRTIKVNINSSSINLTATNTGPICGGGKITLNASNVVNGFYSWTGPDGFSSSEQNPTIANIKEGLYTVKVIGGCSGTESAEASTNVIVNPKPTVTASYEIPVCATGTLYLKATPPEGVTYTYSWKGPGFTSNQQNPSLPAKAGTYTVTATLLDGTCSNTSSTTVTLTAATPKASNNSPVCDGANIILSTDAVPGATYSWTGPNGFTSNLQNPEITNAKYYPHNGTYQLQISVGGCTSSIATTNVLVVPRIGITATSPCEGGILKLATPDQTGATFKWTGPNGFSASIRNPTIDPAKITDKGTYTVVVTANGCTATASIDAIVYPKPAITASNNNPVCVEDKLILSAVAPSGSTYSWSGPGGFTSNLQNPELQPAIGGTYTVTATLGPCTNTASTAVIIKTIPKSTAGNLGPVCEGGSLTLTATPVTGATYRWTGPNGFISTDQNPVIAQTNLAHTGVYQVQAVIGVCKSALSTTNAVINPIPIANATASANPVCIGDKLTLSTDPVQGATYIWKAPNGVISNQRNLQIDPVTSGTAGIYTVTVIAKGCTSAVSSVDVKVSPIPDAPSVSSNEPVCYGAQIKLFATPVAGATYYWTGPNSFTSTEQNPTIDGATSSGNYKVRAIVNGCSSVVASTSVTVKPLRTGPTASANSPVCFGGAINLKATPIAGATGYTWTGPDGFTSNQQNPIATATSTGDYKVTAQVAGCPTAAGIVRVVVNPAGTGPSASGNSPVCEGGKLSLSITTPVAGTTYNWSGPNGFTSTSSNPVISGINANQAGDYKVTATSAGCTTSHTVVSVVVDPLQPGPGISGNTNLCGGDNLSLSVTPVVDGAIYTWVQPDGSSFTGPTLTVANVIYIHSGLYKVTSKTGDCSSAVSSVSVTVNSFSSSPTAGNKGAACEGGIISLTASDASGAGVGYSWEGPNGFKSNEQNPVLLGVTTAQAGSYKVKFVAGTCFSSESVTNVVVNAAPDAPSPSNSSPVCPNGSVQLSLNVVNGAQYQWTGPDGFTSNLPTPVVNNVTEKQAGNYKVTATINGCVSLAGSTKVEVSPLSPPQVENQGVYCLGAPIVLTASSPVSGAMFQWTGPNNFTASGSTVNIPQATFAYVGKYSVYTEVNGCKSEPTDTYVSVGRLITATENHTNVTATGANDGSIAVKIISGAPPYQFKLNQGNFTVDNNFVKLAEGNYSVTVQYGNGCTYEIKDIVIKKSGDDCVR